MTPLTLCSWDLSLLQILARAIIRFLKSCGADPCVLGCAGGAMDGASLAEVVEMTPVVAVA